MTVIHVGATPEPFTGKGLFFDGEAATPHRARLYIDERRRSLVIVPEVGEAPEGEAQAQGHDPIYWPLDELRSLRDQADPKIMVLRRTTDLVARLVLSTAEEQRIMIARAGKLRKAPPVERKGRLLAWSVGAVASVALMVTVLIPVLADGLAEYIPPAGERALGDATLGQIRSVLDDTGIEALPFCETPAGTAALAQIGDTLFPGGIGEHDLTVHVLDHEMVNAFALPGGIVVFFRGLLEEAETPEEVAAVYAHEVGHVVARDPTRIALRSAGSIGVLGLLFGDFAGGALLLFLTERIIQADHSQEAEAAADSFAHAAMADAGFDPAAMATFFERLRAEHGETDGFVQHLMAHPNLSDRIAAARASAPDTPADGPILDAESWAALQNICAASDSSEGQS